MSIRNINPLVALLGVAAMQPTVQANAVGRAVGGAATNAAHSEVATSLCHLNGEDLKMVIRCLAAQKAMAGCSQWACKTKNHGEVGPG
jgi:hypothetical protein